MVFGNTNNGEGYDLVLLGQVEPTLINLDEVEAKLASPRYSQVAQSLREIGFNPASICSRRSRARVGSRQYLRDARSIAIAISACSTSPVPG